MQTEKNVKSTNKGYTGKNIKVLKGLSMIRQNPDMFVGAMEQIPFHLYKEVMDNSIDEFMNGFADNIKIFIDTSSNILTLTDNGRGIPVDIHPTEKKPTMEVLFGTLYSGGKYDKNSFKISAGKNGVGVKAVNALSQLLHVTSYIDGYQYSMEFSKGETIGELSKTKLKKNPKKHGSEIIFSPDEELLQECAFFNNNILKLIKEDIKVRSYINPGLKIEFQLDDNEVETFYHPDGLREWLDNLNAKPMNDPVEITHKDKDGNTYDIIFNFANESDENIYSFVNGIKTDRGTHETGFKTGITSAFTDYIKNSGILTKKLETLQISGEDVRSGLYAIISLKHTNAQYTGQTKSELSNKEVRTIVQKITNEGIKEWIQINSDTAKKIANRIIMFAKGRKEANNIKDKIIKINSSSTGLAFPAKFTDCSSKNIKDRELILIEGISAAGSTRVARNPETQAIYPCRGKGLNTYGVPHSKILNNQEFKDIIKILFGNTDMSNVDYDSMRYGKIILLSDADDDGKIKNNEI